MMLLGSIKGLDRNGVIRNFDVTWTQAPRIFHKVSDSLLHFLLLEVENHDVAVLLKGEAAAWSKLVVAFTSHDRSASNRGIFWSEIYPLLKLLPYLTSSYTRGNVSYG
jgi:hypothetical protein